MADADDREEAALLAAVGRGDDSAFAVIYRRYLPLVVRWCWRETGNRELAADLSAEVFAAALTAARRYRPEQGSVVAWLLGIARNKLRESRRRGRVEDAARRRLGVAPAAITDADLERVEELASSATPLALRTPDPAGGLPWGMRLLRTTRALLCVQVGRVDFGTVGALGRDGAFGNDGRFHPFSENFEQGPPCVTPDAHGNAYLNVAQYGISASALLAGPRGPRCRAPRSLVGVPPRFRASTARQLRRVRGPFCPIAELRDVYYGLLGPDAVSVTHQTPSGGLVTTPTTGPDGPYLIVLPNQPTINNGGLSYNAALFPGAVRAVTYRNGQSCRLPGPNVPGRGGASCPTVGYVSPAGSLPPPAEVAARVTAHLEIAKHYCVNGRLTEPCSTRISPGFTRLPMRSPRGQVIVPEGLLVVSFTARVAVTNGHSYYYIQSCNPPPNAHSQIPR